MKKILLSTVVLAATLQQANAAYITNLNDSAAIVISGEILEGDDQILRTALANRAANNLETKFAFLNSPGGVVSAGAGMAELLRVHGIAVGVHKGDQCISACFMLFAAAPKRYFSEGVYIGVHSASAEMNDGSYGENEFAQATTLKIARYLTAVNTPSDFITMMLITTPDKVTYLTTDELIKDGWAEFSPTEQETATAPVAQPTTAPVVQPQTPAPAAESNSLSLYCYPSTTGKTAYYVSVEGNRTRIRDRYYMIDDAHQNTNTGAYVIQGNTKYGRYQAVFGGPKPRMVYWNGKETVIDMCILQR